MASIAVSLKDQVKQSVDIVELVGEYVSLQRAGRAYKGLCPFHDDHRPSLTVDPDRQSFKCWSCGKGGDVFSFVQEKERVEFSEALAMLAKRAGISLGSSRKSAAEGSKSLYYEVMAWAEAELHLCLLQSPSAKAAREYLRQRGIAEESTGRFRLGFHPDDWQWLCNRARGKRFPTEVLARLGLIKARDAGEGFHDRFVGRLMFPIRDIRGRNVAFGARLLPGSSPADAPKYLNSPETPLFNKSQLLYGLELARAAIAKSGTAIVVEGYTDCILAHQVGLTNVVAPLGTALTDAHVSLLKRHAQTVALVFDGDEAGWAAAERALGLFLGHDVDLRICTLPAGKDPCDWVAAEGREPFERAVEQAPEVLEYYLGRLGEKFDISAIQGRYQAAHAFAELVARLPRLSPRYEGARRTREWMVIDKVARKIEVPESRVRDIISQLRAGPSSARQEPASSEEVHDALELELVEIVLHEPAYLGDVSREVPLESFRSTALRLLIQRCMELAEQGLRPTYARLTAELEDLELKRLATDLEAAARRKGNVHQRFEGVLREWRRRRETQKTDQLQQRLREPSQELEQQLDLLRQLQESKRVQQQLV